VVVGGPGGSQGVGGPPQASGVGGDPGPCGGAPRGGVSDPVTEEGWGEVGLGSSRDRFRPAVAGQGRAQVEQRGWAAVEVRGGQEPGGRGRRSRRGRCGLQGEQPLGGGEERLGLGLDQAEQAGGARLQEDEAGLGVEALDVDVRGRRGWQDGGWYSCPRRSGSDRAVDCQVQVVPGAGGGRFGVDGERRSGRRGSVHERRAGAGSLSSLETATRSVETARRAAVVATTRREGGGHNCAAGVGRRGRGGGARWPRSVQHGPSSWASRVRGGVVGGEDRPRGWGSGPSEPAVVGCGGAVGGKDPSRRSMRGPGVGAGIGGVASPSEAPVTIADGVTRGLPDARALGHA
jgi:hypothetical protein